MECTFVVGQKVVCIDDAPVGSPWVPIIAGQIYTISGFIVNPLARGQPCVTLLEQQNGLPGYVPDGGYLASRFRPLVATKTDISLFQKILEEASKEAKEKV